MWLKEVTNHNLDMHLADIHSIALKAVPDRSKVDHCFDSENAIRILEKFPGILDSSCCPKITFVFSDKEVIQKTITLRRSDPSDDAWGRANKVAKSCFELAVRVHNLEEADQIRFTLENSSECSISIASSDQTSDFKIWVQKTIQYSHFAAMEEGEQELHIQPNFQESSPAACLKLLSALLYDFQLSSSHHSIYDQRAYDMQTVLGRRTWAKDSFHQWYLDLSYPEISSLKTIGTYEYVNIHEVLRNHAKSLESNERVFRDVINIDSAIAKGQLNRDIVIYRSVGIPFIEWANKNSTEIDPIRFADPAYLFFSLHKNAALGWNSCNKDRVILEISAPKGTNAAYLQVPGIHPERDLDEIMLPRYTKLLIHSITHDESNDVPIMHGRIEM